MAQNEYILIVDDDCDIRNLLGIHLENEGYRFIKCDRNSAENISPVLQPPTDRGKPAVTRHNYKKLRSEAKAVRPEFSCRFHKPQSGSIKALLPIAAFCDVCRRVYAYAG